MKRVIVFLALCVLVPLGAQAQPRLIKVIVGTPKIDSQVFKPYADVMSGAIIRELNRNGGMEIEKRDTVEKLLKKKGYDEWISDRDIALEVGEDLNADIVIFSTLSRTYNLFNYSIVFLEVDKDVVQRVIHGSMRESVSAKEIGRKMTEETEKIIKYFPLPSELDDPGSIVREDSSDPEFLPPEVEITNLPPMDRYGYLEQVLSYFRVFPGQLEYQKLNTQELITKMQFRADLDDELVSVLNQFYINGDFAIRHNLQAFLVKDCSLQAINVLLANKIPVFYTDGILVGYSNLTPDGFCMFKTIDKTMVDGYDITHRKRVAVMFIVPKPGQRMGLSKNFLEYAVGFYRDEIGKTPTLVEIKESMFDIIASGLE